MNNVVTTLSPSFFDWIFFIFAGNKETHNISDGFEIWQDPTYELPALERLEKSPLTYNERNVLTTLVLLILNGSSSFLQTRRTTIKAWLSLNFVKISSPIIE